MSLRTNTEEFNSPFRVYSDFTSEGDKEKNGQATFIAPLQPSTLASFPPWGSSKGADRKRLARHKGSKSSHFTKRKVGKFKLISRLLINRGLVMVFDLFFQLNDNYYRFWSANNKHKIARLCLK